MTDFAIPAGDANYEALVTFTPPEFWVAADADVPDGAVDALFILQHVVGLRPVLCPAS